ncbi:MAG: hypothetical protein H6623_09395 [Bdellovibrionaceae bacterium]|nr:hypothetical protein [Pseudobdellovibrionaceae bacterium]
MAEKRYSDRHDITPLEIHGMISIANLTPICDFGLITDASSTGFKLMVKHKDLCSQDLKGDMNIDSIRGLEVSLYIPIMDLDITGYISRTKYVSNKQYEIGIDFRDDAPEYWRQCLCDLLPRVS